jgi:hypothetical protein
MMKKGFFRIAVVAMLLTASNTASAQFDLNSVLGSVLNNGSSSDIVEGLTGIFSADKQATANKIVGTWAYSEPAIVFTSDNLLAKAASKIASNKVENKIQEYLTKYGIKPGALSITFNEDGTFVETLNGKSNKGKWSVKDSKLLLTVTGIKQVAITTQIDGKDMQFVTDATKLLNMFKTLGAKSTNSNIKTVTSLMKNVNGMQAGVTLRKQ